MIQEMARKFGFDIDPRKKVDNMAVSEKQTLEIIKVLYYGAKVIILDEPTAVLTVQEIDKLFDVLRRMKEEGHSIIIITHKLNEVLEISDRVAILRKGGVHHHRRHRPDQRAAAHRVHGGPEEWT